MSKYLALVDGKVVEVPLPSAGGGSSEPLQRSTATETSLPLNTNASSSFLFNDIGRSYRLLRVQFSRPARLQVYSSIAQRTADAGRAIGVEPTGDHGLMFEFVATDQLLAADCSPLVDGYVSGTDTSMPCRITNLGTPGAVTTTITYVRTE